MNTTLEFADVWKAYGPGLSVLRGLTFSVSTGEVALLVGENGAGKTTAFDLACGNRRVDMGQVRVHGRAVSGCSAEGVGALGVRRMYQVPAVFPTLPILDNVLLGKCADFYGRFIPWPYLHRRQLIWEEVRARATTLFGVCPFLEGHRRLVGELSYGEQRVVEFLRVYSGGCSRSLFLLDEPFAAIHPDVADVMWQMVRRLASSGATVLVIEHENEVARFDGVRRLRLAGGRLQ